MPINRWTIRRLLRRAGHYFHSTGLLLGTLFFALSLSPSLVPRMGAMQGLLSGLSLLAGYGIGAALYHLWVYFHLPRFNARVLWRLQWLAGAICLAIAVLFIWQAGEWQNELRRLMGMNEISGVQISTIGLVALLVFLSLLALAHLFVRTFRFLSARLQRFVPARVSHLIGLLLAFALFWSIIDGVFFTRAFQAADRSYQQIDELIEPEIAQPLDAGLVGSAQSLIAWESLGRQGRRYISATPTVEQIASLAGEPAMRPIRVYVGLNSAESNADRAELALRELLRTDAFDRDVLLLVTPTGDGWIDPASVTPLEFLHRGSVASVAAQYSYLSSPLALLSESEYGVELARQMFQTIYGYWSELPADSRPRLYLTGLSLGARNSDLSFDFYDIIDDPFHGALWSGPPFSSETWRDVTQRRDADTPHWRPSFRDGAVVRFFNQNGSPDYPEDSWGAFRIAFLQYASDPITFFDPMYFYREPPWMSAQRGPDVLPTLRWYPVVTMLQLAADMTNRTAPRGFGHWYAASHYHDVWLAMSEPENWTAEQLHELREFWQDHPDGRLPAR